MALVLVVMMSFGGIGFGEDDGGGGGVGEK